MDSVVKPEMQTGKSKRYDICEFRDIAILLLKRKCEISLKGKTVIQCIQGKAYILGFCLGPDGKSFPVYSPNSHSLLTITTSKSRDASYSPDDLSKALKANIPSITNEELSQVLSLAKKRSAILLLKPESSPVFDYVSGFDHFHQLFDGGSKKHSPYQGLYIDAVNLQVIEDASNKTSEPDFYEEIGQQFLRGLRDGSEPVIAVCGGKDSGKSTFCRYLVNRTLNNSSSVAYLDCDLGQTEFTPPGCVSLSLVTEPVLGPPFTHNRQPLSVCYTGSTSPSSDPMYYLECLKYVYGSYLRLNPRPPLVVNTMGWTEGLGLYLLVETLLMVRPTIVVQLKSTHLRQNLPEMSPDFVADFTESPEFLRRKRWSAEYHSKTLGYKLYNVNSPSHDKQDKNRRHLVPADFRNLMSLSYLAQGLAISGVKASLHDVPLHRVLLKDVAIRIFGADIPHTHILCAINASIVALCSITDDLLIGTEQPEFPKRLRSTPIDCLGFGLVHHVSVEDEAVFVVSPLSESVLSRVNCLMSGCDGVPKHLLLQLKIGEDCPYVGCPKDALGSSSLKPRGRNMTRKRARSESNPAEHLTPMKDT